MPTTAPAVSDKDIVDAYHYMLGRWIVLRRERLDFAEGSRWNEIVHHAPGGVAWPDPNLDLACSDAWVFVDEASATLVEVPEIAGRYHTVQVCNGWGEVVANINERNFPHHPHGRYALCLAGTDVVVPGDAARIELPGRKARVLVQIELGAQPIESTALQRRVTLKATGVPRVESAVVEMDFADDRLPGVDGFDYTEAILRSEPDVNGGMEVPQRMARAVAAAAAHGLERERIDEAIRRLAVPALLKAMPQMMREENGWLHPRIAGNYGSDYLMRTIANLTGRWTNSRREIVHFIGKSADGSAACALTFPPHALPGSKARYFWSIVAVDDREHRVVPNPLDRFRLDARSDLAYANDGSLTLYLAPEAPPGAPEANWLPTPRGRHYDLTLRLYGPSEDVVAGEYFPPRRVAMD
jgi:hypothetical protein